MNLYLIIILTIIIGNYLLDTIVKILNTKNMQPELPQEFIGTYDEEKYKKSQEYTRETTRFSHFSSTFSTTLTIVFILLGGFNYIDIFARSFEFNSIITGLIFTGTLILLSSTISLPFSIYSTFIIEEKYGFNKTTVKTFILDLIKGLILGAIIGAAILSGILWFFTSMGEFAWIYSWLGVLVFSLILQFLAPVLIMPLFNKFSPLEDGELKVKITNYAKKENFKMKGIFTMDGSKRSTKANAYFTGFGKFRRIVFFDTLTDKLNSDELLAVLAHEMGHFKLKHILKSMIIGIITMGFTFFILSLFMNNKELFKAFKMEHLSVYASLIFFMFLYSPIELVLSIFGNIFSRKNEYEADSYSIGTTGDANSMISALKKLSVENLSNLTPHSLNVFLNYSHPPILKRIETIKNLK